MEPVPALPAHRPERERLSVFNPLATTLGGRQEKSGDTPSPGKGAVPLDTIARLTMLVTDE